MKVEATKIFSVDSAHSLVWHKGKCQNLHGHTYKIELTYKDQLNKNGIVKDFGEFEIPDLDHKYLNDIMPNPTAENMAIYILEKTNAYKVKVWETPTSFVEVKSENNVS